jgi:hypothetical protein
MTFEPDVHYVSPDGTRRVVDGEPRETLRLEAALKMVQPGQTVQLLGGVYTEPVEIANKGGSFDRPIVIRGESSVTFDGRRNLVRPTDGESVDRRAYAFIKILDSQGIILENFTIQNVWPTAVYIGQSSEIVLRRLNLHGGTYAVFARGDRTREHVRLHPRQHLRVGAIRAQLVDLRQSDLQRPQVDRVRGVGRRLPVRLRERRLV